MKTREYETLLQTKFHFEQIRTSKHTFYVLKVPGLRPVRTMVSHGKNADVGPRLESDLARELGVPTRFLRGMFSCSHSCEEYCDLLRAEPSERQNGRDD